MTWCKGCKKDISPSHMDAERGFCEDCVAYAEAYCESDCDLECDGENCPCMEEV